MRASFTSCVNCLFMLAALIESAVIIFVLFHRPLAVTFLFLIPGVLCDDFELWVPESVSEEGILLAFVGCILFILILADNLFLSL